MRRSLRRPLAVVSTILAIGLVLAPSAEAQRKKPAAAGPAKKKPAPAPAPAPAAKPKPEATKPAEKEPPPAEEPTTAKPTKKPAAEEEEEKPKEAEKEPERPSTGGSKPVMFDIAAGIRGFQRHLGYKDDWYGVLPSYDLSGAPEADVAIGVFPIKNATGSITAGLVANLGYAFALGSTYKQPPPGATTGTKYTTKSMQLAVGGRVNFNFGTSTLGLGAEFGLHSFGVDLPPPDPNNAGVPDVAYKFIRPHVAARIGIADKISILANAGYLLVLGAGEIVSDTYFPSKNAGVGGIDVSLGVGYEIAHNIEIRPSLDFRRYFYKFSWSPASDIRNAPYPAGGAIDQYYGASLLVGFRF